MESQPNNSSDNLIKFLPKPKPNQPHPLLVDLVLEKVFKYLPIRDLRTGRLVCGKWESLITDLLLEKTRLDLTARSTYELESIFDSVKNDSCLQYENVTLSMGAATREGSDRLNKLFNEIIEPLSDSIHSLYFLAWEDCFDGGPSSLQLLNSILMAPIKLTSLTLGMMPRAICLSPNMFPKPHSRDPMLPYLENLTIYGRANYGKGFTIDLFMAMPNLKKVLFKHPSERTVSIFLNVMISFDYKKLNDLSFVIDGIFPPFPLNQQIAKLAAICPFHLETLEMDMSGQGPFEEHEQWQRQCSVLLSNNRKTLTKLKITHKHRKAIPRVQVLEIPFLPELKHLHLDNWTDLGSIHFLDNLPKLEYLGLDSWKIKQENLGQQFPVPENYVADAATLFSNEMHSFKSLRKLSLPPYSLPTNIFDRILSSFPNLKILTISATDTMLSSLYLFAPTTLKELELDQKSQITDFGLTGMQGLLDQNLKTTELERIDKNDVMIISDKIDACKTPSIRSLLNLRRLKIDGRFSWITDLSIHFGLKFLKNLTSLTLINCKMTTHSLEAFKNLPLMHLDLTNSLPARFKIEDIYRLEALIETLPFLHLQNKRYNSDF